MRSTKYHLLSITLVSCVLSGLSDGFQLLVVGSTELRCHCWSNGFQLHLLCEAQNCVVTVGATAFNYACCAKHRIALSLLEQRLSINACCAKHRIALSLLEQRLSITLVVRSTELRCHCWSNGFQLRLLCEAQNCVVTWSNGFQLHLLCEAQNCVVTVGATAFNCCTEQCKTSSRMSDC